MIVVIYEKERHITRERIIVSIDYWKEYKIITKMLIANHYAQDRAVEAAEIRKLAKDTKFQIEFQFRKSHEELKRT